jgi:lipid A 3-O-deacylase
MGFVRPHATIIALLIATATLGLQCQGLGAQELIETIVNEGRPSSTLEIDNDSLLLRRDDGLYTSGVRFSRSYRLRSSAGWRSAGWRLGQQLYTPSDVRVRPEHLNSLDRPYAGWLYGGLFYNLLDFDGSELAFGLDLGCLGPCAGGRATQTFVHRVFDQPEPRGWRTQIRNELGVVLRAGARAPYWRLNRHIDLRPGVALRLGNIFTDLTADATLRAGRLEPLAGAAGFYVFARGAVRAVAYDATLQGGMFSDDQVRTVSPRRTTSEWELGLQWHEGSWAWRLSLVRRGNEIAGLPESLGRQDFLRLSIIYFP